MRSIHLYHSRIIHLGNLKEVSPSKSTIFKSLIYLFFYSMSLLHNTKKKEQGQIDKGKIFPNDSCPV